jgi:hypothetical protein
MMTVLNALQKARPAGLFAACAGEARFLPSPLVSPDWTPLTQLAATAKRHETRIS